MSKRYSKINVYPVLYLLDTNNDYVLDANNNKIIIEDYTTVSPNSNFNIVTEITNLFFPLESAQPEEGGDLWVATVTATDSSAILSPSYIAPEYMGNVNTYEYVKPMINIFDCVSDGGYENSSANAFITGATGCLSRFPSTISKLLELPEGKRAIYLRRYNQGPVLENTQDRYPSGRQIPWAENDITLLQNDWSIIANAMKNANAIPDLIIGDLEQNPFSFFSIGGNTAYLNEITGDARISQPWYTDISFENYYTFNGQFPLSYTEIYSNTYHPQLNTQYLRWDTAMKALFDTLINESLYKISKNIFGDNIKFSNYASKLVSINNYYYNQDGHPEYRQTYSGDGMSPVLYAGWRFANIYGVYNLDPTRLVRTNFAATTEFPLSAWNQLLILINNIRAVKRSAPSIPLRPYIGTINFTGDAAYNPQWKVDAASEGLYWESIRHFSLTGTEMLISWNESDTTVQLLEDHLIKLNTTIEDINDRLGGYSNTVGNTSSINFLADYIVSGAKIVGSTDYLWRVTPKPGLTLLDQLSNTVTVDSDGGAWIVTNNSTVPTFTKNALPWTPDLLGSGLLVWTDAEDSSTVVQTGSPLRVSSWNDKSEYGRNLTQGNAGARPTLITNTIGSKPAIVFEQSRSTSLRNAFGIQNQPYTLAFVFKTPTNFIQSGMVVSSANINDPTPNNTQTTANFFSNNLGVSWSLNTFAGSGTSAVQGDNLTPETNYFTVLQYNGASTQYSVNGTNSTVNPGTKAISGIELGAWNNGGNASNVSLGEVIVLDSTLNTNDRQLLEGYLAHKWNLTSNLPLGHPYKTNPPTYTP